MIYHSALKEDLDITQELDYFEKDHSFVFKHNLENGIHELYKKADVIYSEPAWRDGYNKFMQRAGAEGNFNQYLDSIRSIIETLEIPAYIVMGSHMKKRLNPNFTQSIKLHGYKCLLGVWDGEEIKAITNYDTSHEIARKYNCLLDFCCGYGNTARDALWFNKKFICSDVNGKCVYYVATQVMQ